MLYKNTQISCKIEKSYVTAYSPLCSFLHYTPNFHTKKVWNITFSLKANNCYSPPPTPRKLAFCWFLFNPSFSIPMSVEHSVILRKTSKKIKNRFPSLQIRINQINYSIFLCRKTANVSGGKNLWTMIKWLFDDALNTRGKTW